MLKGPKLIEGHYECRSFDETVPVFTDILGMEVIQRRSDTEWVMKHPNTGWSMVLHAAGPNAKDKPLMNHYGWRVSSREEVDRAQEYLKKVKDEYHLPRVGRPCLLHIAYSFYFGEPGGNSLELEYYEPDVVKASAVYGPHWERPYAADRFAGRGYVCQGLSHGTLECDEGEKREPSQTSDRAAAVTCPLPTQDQAQPEPARVTWGKEHPGFGWSVWRHSEVSSGTHRTRCAIRILPAAASSRPPPR